MHSFLELTNIWLQESAWKIITDILILYSYLLSLSKRLKVSYTKFCSSTLGCTRFPASVSLNNMIFTSNLGKSYGPFGLVVKIFIKTLTLFDENKAFKNFQKWWQ